MPAKAIGSCAVEGCTEPLNSKGYCRTHYIRMKKYGRTELIRQKNAGSKCSAEGCQRDAEAHGMCNIHRKKVSRNDPTKKRTHKFYSLWWDRKSRGLLGPEWANDFEKFCQDIGERPFGNFSLVRKRNELYGPNNFEWREWLQRRAGESKKDWWARKWQARKVANPGWERARDLKRKYGITTERYEEMLSQQNGLCAICNKPESKIDTQNGNFIALAVDHCHTTKKVRGLLCNRCNTTIGRIEESIELLRAMEVYMQRHLNNQLL